MKNIYPPKVEKLLAVFTTRPAETSGELRQRVTAHAQGNGAHLLQVALCPGQYDIKDLSPGLGRPFTGWHQQNSNG